MSIASEITRINNNISAAYTACNNKGATMPQTQNSANLATTIGTITTGSTANYKEFTYSSASAVSNKVITIVSGDSDVAAHYNDTEATVTIRKNTNTTIGLAFVVASNHGLPNAYGSYLNYNSDGNNNVALINVSLSDSDTSPTVCLKADSNGDIKIKCGATRNNFGGSSYTITFSW